MSGTRKNISEKKYDRHEETNRLKKTAKKMAEEVQKKIEGKTRIPHPDIKNAWIYV